MIKHKEHDNLFTEVRLWSTYVPVEESTKDGVLSTLFLSHSVMETDWVFFSSQRDIKSRKDQHTLRHLLLVLQQWDWGESDIENQNKSTITCNTQMHKPLSLKTRTGQMRRWYGFECVWDVALNVWRFGVPLVSSMRWFGGIYSPNHPYSRWSWMG
jgi:hypothetical protein